jgi:hypothetical protein
MLQVPDDSLRTVLRRVFDDPAYHWVAPRDPLAFLRQWVDALTRWLERLSADHPLAGDLMVAVLVVVLVVILVHGAFIVAGTAKRAAARESASPSARIVAPRDAAWHRRQSERLTREGRYAEALMEEFWAVIAELDSRHLVRFHPSKTPGEYLSESGLGQADRSRLATLVERLYALVFSGRVIREEDVSDWRTRALKGWGLGAV